MEGSVYLKARQEWDERYADLVLGKRTWQIAAGCSLLVSLVLAAGIVWLALRSRYVPYVVVTDRLGQAITIPKPAKSRLDAGRRHSDGALGNSGVHQRCAFRLERSSGRAGTYDSESAQVQTPG